jgi:hypothetical protein
MSITVRARIKDGIIYPNEDLHLTECVIYISIVQPGESIIPQTYSFLPIA